VAAGCGHTVKELKMALGRHKSIKPGDEDIRTDLQMRRLDGRLRGYDVDRAETAIRMAKNV
jgi:hypothetical protein